METDDVDDGLKDYYDKIESLKSRANAGDIDSSTLNLRLNGMVKGLGGRPDIEDRTTRE